MSGLFQMLGEIVEALSDWVGPEKRDMAEARKPEPGIPAVPDRQAAFITVRNTYTTESGFYFTPLWQRLGWRVNAGNKHQFIGEYRFYDKDREEGLRWEGAIQTGPYEFKVYIRNPPSALRRHRHWQCFNHAGDGWFSIHFLNPLDGLDDAILNVQRLIAEAHWFY